MVTRLSIFGRPVVWIPLALFALALMLRLIGVDWHGQHPDEDISGPARLLSGDLRLHSFYYPPLLTYLVAAADVFLFALGRLLGWWHSAAELRAAYFGNSTPFFVTARVVVAICSAVAAPIAWALARELRLSRNAALMAGIAALLLPAAIYWAHIAKSDNGLGPAYLLSTLCAVRMIERPSSLVRSIQLGVAISVAVSLKQSALFFLVPAFAFLAPWSIFRATDRRLLMRSWMVAIITAFVAAALLNIAILADPEPFLAAQAVQSQMSSRSSSLHDTLRTAYSQLVADNGGIHVLALIVMAALWILGIARGRSRVRLLLIVLGIGSAGAAIIICLIGGSRQPLQLWLPYLVLGYVATAIGAGAMLDGRNRALRVVGGAGFAILIITALVRIVPILTQATAEPMGARVAEIIRQKAPPRARIVSNVDLSAYLPLSPESQTLPRARHERLAKIYGITLPPPEHPPSGQPNGYTVIDFPWVIGGLEAYRADQVKVIVPYAWPLQPQEWQLSSWLAEDFHIFVVSDAAGLIRNPVPAYRELFRAIDRCPRIATVPAARPLFGERNTHIYRCD